MVRALRRFVILGGFAAGLGMVGSCAGGTSFRGGVLDAGPNRNESEAETMDRAEPEPEDFPPGGFAIGAGMKSGFAEKVVWVATHDHIYRILVDEKRDYPMTTWNVPKRGGTRTYVTEIGLIIGKTHWDGDTIGGVYRVSDDNPDEAEQLFAVSDAHNGSRVCVAAFAVNGKSYLGAAYRTSGSLQKFVRIPIDKSKPQKVDLSQMESRTFEHTSDETATYSCFMDQARNHFWVGGTHGGEIWGVNVATLTALSPSQAPNAGHRSDVLELSQNSNSSYAMAGDARGDILTASSFYTFAHEPVSDFVFGGSNESLKISPAKCFRETRECAQHSFDLDAKLGPMSSLNDGRIAAIERGGESSVFCCPSRIVQTRGPAWK